MPIIFPYMIRSGDQQHITEEYVSVPPALTITDEAGAIWTLGFRFGAAPRGEFAFNVLRNGLEIGEIASRIERRHGRIRIFTASGWKYLDSGAIRDDRIRVCGIGARVEPPSPSAAATPVTVTISFEQQDAPLCEFTFTSHLGGLVDRRAAPIICAPGQWLCARIQPHTHEFITFVRAQIAGGALRQIPLVKGVISHA